MKIFYFLIFILISSGNCYQLQQKTKIKHRLRGYWDSDGGLYDPYYNHYSPQQQDQENFGPNSPYMDPNAFRNGNTSNNNLFEINSAKEAEMEWETENTNKYYSNRKEADEEFWNKHKDALNHPYHQE